MSRFTNFISPSKFYADKSTPIDLAAITASVNGKGLVGVSAFNGALWGVTGASVGAAMSTVSDDSSMGKWAGIGGGIGGSLAVARTIGMKNAANNLARGLMHDTGTNVSRADLMKAGAAKRSSFFSGMTESFDMDDVFGAAKRNWG